MMTPQESLAIALNPARILEAQGIQPDPWQVKLLLNSHKRILLLCSRGAGKSRTVSALALHTALFQPKSLTLLVSRAQRQSLELFRYVKEGYNALKRPIATVKENETTLELENGSRIIALPGKEGSIRAYQGVTLLILDEASRVPDDLYYSVRPMLGVSQGRLLCLTTPFGQRGFFYQEWEHGGEQWCRIKTTWQQCPRIDPEFIEQERASLGDGWVRQEYECEFSSLEGLVYPDFESCVWDVLSVIPPNCAKVGGIDFGWRNPFAAIWGGIDANDVLWIVGERYKRNTPIHEHRDALKALGEFTWYADPSGATEIAELKAADLLVRKGNNDIALGIAAVNARIHSKRLRVSRAQCPNLIAEARLYRYPTIAERQYHGEKPIDDNNHALGALRYLISRIDHRFMAKLRNLSPDRQPDLDQPADLTEKHKETLRSVYGVETFDDDSLWETMG